MIEIGAGVGSLSAYLSEAAAEVEAVEIDERLIPALEAVAGYYQNLRPLCADALTLNLAKLTKNQNYLVIGNIPYNITSHLIRNLLEQDHPPDKLILTIQREVALRVLAEPGQMNLLALGVQAYGKPVIRGDISANSFYPPPRVESSILSVEPFANPMIPKENLDRVFLLAKTAFNQKRKQLRNSLAGDHFLTDYGADLAFKEAGVKPTRRPQELSIEDWVRLARVG